MISTTAKQKQLLDFIKGYIAENGGKAPSFEEMKAAVGLASKSGVHRLIAALEERGLLRRLPNRARAMKVLEEYDAFLAAIPTDALHIELGRRFQVYTDVEPAAPDYGSPYAVRRPA